MLTHITEFLNKCFDPITLEIPDPQDAVRLLNHPVVSARWKIYDESKFLIYQKQKPTDYHNVALTPVQMESVKVGRPMTVGLVAIYQQLMTTKKTPELEHANNLIHIIECLHYFLIVGKLSEHQYAEIQKLPTLATILTQNKVDDIIPTMEGMRVSLKMYLSKHADKFKKLFDDLWEPLQELLDWFADPTHTLAILQAKKDLLELQQGKESLPSIQYPSLGIYYKEFEPEEVAWLKSYHLLETLVDKQTEKAVVELSTSLSQITISQDQKKAFASLNPKRENCNNFK